MWKWSRSQAIFRPRERVVCQSGGQQAKNKKDWSRQRDGGGSGGGGSGCTACALSAVVAAGQIQLPSNHSGVPIIRARAPRPSRRAYLCPLLLFLLRWSSFLPHPGVLRNTERSPDPLRYRRDRSPRHRLNRSRRYLGAALHCGVRTRSACLA